MDDLVAFVRARLDEDEHLARELSTFAGDGVWRESGGGLASGAYELLAAYRAQGSLSSWHLAHIARHDPARVLREVEAKRRLLAIDESQRFKDEFNNDVVSGWLGAHLLVAELLALPYADHPDYRPEWAA